ncbi:MAG: EAL domain-containing protein [Bacillota bacterium]|nr:EAL domain-containing protein [Bacillota bacterium]
MRDNHDLRKLLTNYQFEEESIKNNTWRIVLIYGIVGCLWIIFSDMLLLYIVKEPDLVLSLQTIKGWFYVFSTSLLLYFLVKIGYSEIYGLTKTLYEKNEELVSFSEELIAKDDELNEKILKLNETMKHLEDQKRFKDEIFNTTSTVVMIWNLSGELIETNDRFSELFKFESQDAIGHKWDELLLEEKEGHTREKILMSLGGDNKLESYENYIIAKDGKRLCMLWNKKRILDPNTGVPMVVSFGVDITEEKTKEAKIIELAYKDRLTGLGNRVMFEQEVEDRIEKQNEFVLYYLDFDNFKNLNDIYGHELGDRFLKEFAHKISSEFSDMDMFRWCGDEFLMVGNQTNNEDIKIRMSELMAVTGQKWHIDHMDYYPSISVGITEYPKDGLNLSELLMNADMALHKAKRNGKDNYVYYKTEFRSEVEQITQVESRIQNAIEQSLFRLHFQPIYQLNNLGVIGFEVLLRFDSELFNMTTGELIAIAEQTGQISAIDRWVVNRSFEYIKSHMMHTDHIISINLSSKSLSSNTIVEYIKALLLETGINPGRIEIELTEYSLINYFKNTLLIINSLKDLGIKISLDDFGTQYSSLNYLSKIPFDTLKIDKSYIDQIVNNTSERIIVEEIINLSNKLGVQTIAEGVESKEQLSLLTRMGCCYAQGYHLDRPMAVEHLTPYGVVQRS